MSLRWLISQHVSSADTAVVLRYEILSSFSLTIIIWAHNRHKWISFWHKSGHETWLKFKIQKYLFVEFLTLSVQVITSYCWNIISSHLFNYVKFYGLWSEWRKNSICRSTILSLSGKNAEKNLHNGSQSTSLPSKNFFNLIFQRRRSALIKCEAKVAWKEINKCAIVCRAFSALVKNGF